MLGQLERFLYDPFMGKAVAAVVGILIVGVLVRILRNYVVKRVRDSDARYRARKFITFLGYVAAIVVLITAFSDRLAGLTVAFGVAGAGIAFALQEVIASFAGWFAVSFANFYKTGDRVQLGGIKGDVIDISILRTTIMEVGEWVKGDQYTGRVVRVANSFVFKEPVYNYSGDFPFLWDEIAVPVKHESDRRMARSILERVALDTVGLASPTVAEAWKNLVANYHIEDAITDPVVTLVANDNWLEFTVRYTVDYKMRRSTKDRLFTRILEEFDKTDGRVSFASATFHLVETPVFDVRIRDDKNPV